MSSLNRACQRLLVRIADRVFRRDDLHAHDRGWTIGSVRRGTGRHYRDPRWDRLGECTHCRGAGFLGIDACPRCGGRGVIDTGAAVSGPTARAAVEPTSPRGRAETLRVRSDRLDLPAAPAGPAAAEEER